MITLTSPFVPAWMMLAMIDKQSKPSGRKLFKLAIDGKLAGHHVIVHHQLSSDLEIHDAIIAYVRASGATVMDGTRGETG